MSSPEAAKEDDLMGNITRRAIGVMAEVEQLLSHRGDPSKPKDNGAGALLQPTIEEEEAPAPAPIAAVDLTPAPAPAPTAGEKREKRETVDLTDSEDALKAVESVENKRRASLARKEQLAAYLEAQRIAEAVDEKKQKKKRASIFESIASLGDDLLALAGTEEVTDAEAFEMIKKKEVKEEKKAERRASIEEARERRRSSIGGGLAEGGRRKSSLFGFGALGFTTTSTSDGAGSSSTEMSGLGNHLEDAMISSAPLSAPGKVFKGMHPELEA